MLLQELVQFQGVSTSLSGWVTTIIGGGGSGKLCYFLVRNHLLSKRTQGSQPGALDLLTPIPPVWKMEVVHQHWPANTSA